MFDGIFLELVFIRSIDHSKLISCPQFARGYFEVLLVSVGMGTRGIVPMIVVVDIDDLLLLLDSLGWYHPLNGTNPAHQSRLSIDGEFPIEFIHRSYQDCIPKEGIE
jgi:hypothetical protein